MRAVQSNRHIVLKKQKIQSIKLCIALNNWNLSCSDPWEVGVSLGVWYARAGTSNETTGDSLA